MEDGTCLGKTEEQFEERKKIYSGVDDEQYGESEGSGGAILGE